MLKVNDDIRVDLYPCIPNKYKRQLYASGDLSVMRGLCKDFSDIRYRIIEVANPGNYEFWVNKKEFIRKQREK